MPELDKLNLKEVCRICFKKDDVMRSVYSKISISSKDDDIEEVLYLSNMLMEITNIKFRITDRVLQLICTNCLENTQASYKFYLKCNKSQRLFDEFKTKTESDNCKNTEAKDDVNKKTEDNKLDIIETNEDDSDDNTGIVSESTGEIDNKIDNDKSEDELEEIPNVKKS